MSNLRTTTPTTIKTAVAATTETDLRRSSIDLVMISGGATKLFAVAILSFLGGGGAGGRWRCVPSREEEEATTTQVTVRWLEMRRRRGSWQRLQVKARGRAGIASKHGEEEEDAVARGLEETY